MLLEIAIVLGLFYLYHRYRFSYWKRRNVVQLPPELIFGNIKELILNRETMSELFKRIYNEYKSHRVVGFYSFFRPLLLVNDPKLVEQILVTEFHKFHENGFKIHKDVDPMFGINPFVTSGFQQWKNARSFHLRQQTLFKLKEYVSYMAKVGENMTEYLHLKKGEPISIKEVASYYTIDNVSTCAFGCEPTAFTDPENGFKKHASSNLFRPSVISNVAALFFPIIGKILKMRIVSEEAQEFFVTLVSDIINFRLKNNVERNDLIGLLIKTNKKNLEEKKPGFTDLEFAGHTITFYLNGFETSSSQLCFTLLEMANNPEVQEKLRKEIFSRGGTFKDFDYYNVMSMPYLSMVLNETLRKHPLVPLISRECTENVKLGDVFLEKGTKVFIPVASFHKDPNYYPNPDEFIPERFLEENKESRVKCTYLPFGEGPRKCLGFRFAELQLKLALICILMKFKVLPSTHKAKEDIIYERKSPFVINAKYGTKLRFEPL